MKKPKCFNFPTASILMLTLALAMSGNARAQVTIGANLEPQSYSVLELISNNTKGLRLPQMDSVQRNTMMDTQAFKDEKKDKALGLQIFNTSTLCVETWNGTKWIEQCMDCSNVPVPAITSPLFACVVGENVPFTALHEGDYQWQTSNDNGTTWTDAEGTGSSNSIVFPSVGSYLVRATSYGCINKVSNTLLVEALNSEAVQVVQPPALKIMTLNNVMYSYQFAKLATYVATEGGTVLGYQWYMKYDGYAEQGAALSTKPARNEAADIIVGANQSSYTFDPYSDDKYAGAGTYYFYCKAFGKNSTVSVDSILVRVEDLYDASRDNMLITKAQWQTDSIAAEGNNNTKADGHIYFIPVLYGTENASLKIAHANLGSTKTRDAGELGNLFQWARDEDGHERRQYEGRYSNWADLDDNTTFISPPYMGPIADEQATVGSDAYGKFILVEETDESWRAVYYETDWGEEGNGSTDPCVFRNPSWRLPSNGGEDFSDWLKLTIGTSISAPWPDNSISGRGAQNTVLYRYPWGSGSLYGSTTVVSTVEFVSGKKYVAILPASGLRRSDSKAYLIGRSGFYWSGTHNGDAAAYNLSFNKTQISTGRKEKEAFLGGQVNGACIRCVAEY
ncbi:MAG: hypothetical protein LBS50_00200 [Prevotellaceae bacterium]|jgi:hypothetical protein|nr:hypothetical protein [Prevotellaceae bacterium]